MKDKLKRFDAWVDENPIPKAAKPGNIFCTEEERVKQDLSDIFANIVEKTKKERDETGKKFLEGVKKIYED